MKTTMVKEWQSQGRSDKYLWNIEISASESDSEHILLGIYGERGGLKARLWVNAEELVKAIQQAIA
jgi:hypothetical protein